MEKSFVVGRKQFILSSISGTVLSEKRTARTHVSGSLSNDLLGGVQGKIKSSTELHQEIWIKREDNGSDFVIQFPNDIPLLEGQKITAVCISDTKSIHWVFLRNEAASTNYQIMNSSGFTDIFFGKSTGCLGIIILAFLVYLFLSVLGSNLAFFGALALFILLMVASTRQRKKRRELYKDSLALILSALGIDSTIQ